jgi:phosphoenolpyruvate---glycerone phosphotransferase subunit DhaM
MVSLVFVSHSPKVAEGSRDMARQMVSGDISVEAAGGTRDGRLGTDVEAIQKAIRSVLGPDGVVVLVDIGGAVISVEMALDGLTEEEKARVVIADAPLVEGGIMAATQASVGAGLSEVKKTAEEARSMKKLD